MNSLKNFLTRKKKFKLSPTMIIALSFMLVILIGAIFLFLPISLNEGQHISFIDALFTSTSATCVTGLVPVKEGIGTTFNVFGRTVMAILIALGGLGVTTFAVIFYMIFSKNLGIANQSLIKETWNLDSYKSIRTIFLQVLLVSFFFVFVGSVLTFFDFYFIHHFGFVESIGYSIYHAISAFNNAGFDCIPGNPSSLVMFENDIYLNIVTSLLIIFGGIGFFVIIDMVHKKFRFKKFTLHSKVAITYSIFLIVIGTFLIFLCELNNKSNVSFMGSFFMSVSSRTAGFSMYDLSTFKDVTLLIMIILMFVGASPGSAGGGVKTTTIAMLFAYLRGIITNRKPYLFKRSLNDTTVKKALLIILLGLIFFILGLVFISGFEGEANYVLNGVKYLEYVDGATRFSTIDYAFEAMSAFATVGLSTGLTPYYSIGSKIVLIILMYVGRLGPLSISTLFRKQTVESWHYAEGNVSIG